jgi:hypothetical protein
MEFHLDKKSETAHPPTVALVWPRVSAQRRLRKSATTLVAHRVETSPRSEGVGDPHQSLVAQPVSVISEPVVAVVGAVRVDDDDDDEV